MIHEILSRSPYLRMSYAAFRPQSQRTSCPSDADTSKSKFTSGLTAKKQYAPMAPSGFIRKLCTLLCLECTSWATFFSMSFSDSMMLLLRSMILSWRGISLCSMFDLKPVTMCMPSSQRRPKSDCDDLGVRHHAFPASPCGTVLSRKCVFFNFLIKFFAEIIRNTKNFTNFVFGNHDSVFIVGTSKLLKIIEITKRIGNFFSCRFNFFQLILIPNSLNRTSIYLKVTKFDGFSFK